MRILCIEDDQQICGYIVKNFVGLGHEIECTENGLDGLQKAVNGTFDVAIIDRMLPGLDGISIVRTLRNSGNLLPVILLSSLSQVDDKVDGLRAGGDDYLVKPFAFEELLARVEVLGRRVGRNESPPVSHLSAGDLTLDLIDRMATRDGVEIELLPREFRLLEYLLKNKGQVVTRSMLLESVWDYNFDPQTNLIDVHISRLRGKIDKAFARPLLRTVRGAGYIIED